MTNPPDQPHQPHQPDAPRDLLRERLRSADPAADLPAVPPQDRAALLARTTTDDRTVESRHDGTQARSRLTWLVAVAAVVLIAAGVGFAVVGRDGPGESSSASSDGAGSSGSEGAADGSPGSSGAEGPASTTDLTLAGGAPVGRCAPPSADVVAQQDVAVDATVTSISQGQVTLAPTRFYTGDPTDQVVVQEVAGDLRALLDAVDFVDGQRYLVSASDGEVTLCGLSDAWSPGLAQVYAEAFPS